MTPFFSILVPVYNHEKYVGLALDSLLAQTDPDWEACVVDDGSTDGTPAILDDYARRDSRIRVFHKPNGGEASALNAAWRQTGGTWINWLSSDDLFLPHKLATQREWINRYQSCRYFFTDFQTLDDSTGRLTPGYAAHTPTPGQELIELLASNYINGIAMCVHREVFETVGAFDEASRHGQDYDFHLRAVARYAPLRIPEQTCVQRTHPGQLSQQRTHAMFCDCAASAIRFLGNIQSDTLMGNYNNSPVSEICQKLDNALSVAASPNSFLNRIGPHPAMIMHLAAWVAGAVSADPGNRILVDLMGRKARTFAWTYSGTPAEGLWQALSVMCDLGTLPTCVASIHVEDVVDVAWMWAKSKGDEKEVSALADYAATHQGRHIGVEGIMPMTPPGKVVWLPLMGAEIPEGAVLGVSTGIAATGMTVIVLRAGDPAWRWRRGVLTVQVAEPARAMLALAAAPGDPVVLMVPCIRQAWWWRHVWRVIHTEAAKAGAPSDESEGWSAGGHAAASIRGMARHAIRVVMAMRRMQRV